MKNITDNRGLKFLHYLPILILCAALMLAGATKFIYPGMWLAYFSRWSIPFSVLKPVGFLEILIASGLLIPRLRLFSLYAIFPWLIGSVLVPLFAHLWPVAIISIFLGMLALYSLWTFEEKPAVNY